MRIAPESFSLNQHSILSRQASMGDWPSVFTDVFQDDTNIVIWQRKLSAETQDNARKFIKTRSNFRLSLTTGPEDVFKKLIDSNKELSESTALCENITELVEMFCLLFNQKEVGLRLTTLDHSMCPRFHVDRVPCRLVCTYYGVSTEWLPHNEIDRSKLGSGNNDLPDEESGLFKDENLIKRLGVGDVALLKGELWEDNLNAGLVHRSPQVPSGDARLLMTLDFIS